jgi:hypothetical protein
VLPSSDAGVTTEQVGFFEMSPTLLADWLSEEFGWPQRRPGWSCLRDAALDLVPTSPASCQAVIPVGDDWSLLLNDGPLGTDVALLPSHAARKFGCTGIRAVCVPDDGPRYAARILSVYGAAGDPLLRQIRSVHAVDDGGRWTFDAAGDPLPFETLDAYARRRIRDRFTAKMLYSYLEALRVPFDTEPDWSSAILIQGRLSRRQRRSKRDERLIGVPLWAR